MRELQEDHQRAKWKGLDWMVIGINEYCSIFITWTLAHSTTSVLSVRLPSAAEYVRDGRHCGHRFRVKDGRVAEKEMVYECPFCAGKVESNVRTGRLDHRNVCGNQFYVKNGNINNATRQHAHTCPQCLAVVWSARAAGQIRVQHNAPSGCRCPRNSWTAMPAPEQARKDV